MTKTIAMDYDRFCRRLGEELRAIRQDAGLSRQQLADRSGIHVNSIYKYEAGQDMPVMTFIRLCVAMDSNCIETLQRVFQEGGR